jgi:hypothetical protein
MRPPKIPVPFIAGVLITLVFFIIAFQIQGIEITEKLWIALFFFAFIVGMAISIWRRGIFHQGHFPVVLGFIFVVVGLVMFNGTFTYKEVNPETGELQQREQMWDLTPQESGAFIILIVLGILSIVSGMKQIFANSYWWGRR